LPVSDVGGVWLYHPGFTITQRPYTQLNDVGAGYYATFDYQPGRQVLFRAEIVRTYGGVNGAQTYNRGTKALFQGGVTF
jgi:hypothetical protein